MIQTREEQTGRYPLHVLTLGALGVVFGDIGTSPLYTIKEVFGASTGVPLDTWHLVGAASTIFWSLMMVVTIKYVMLILRADNRGEGGIMALTALASRTVRNASRKRSTLLLLGLFGAALFYGDSIITPAISVLSAVEGLELATPAFKPYVLAISVVIIFMLFMVQKYGTSTVGKLFGPVMVAWFLLLSVSGVVQILQHPAIVAALDPRRAVGFLIERGWGLFPAMGAIVLALTGAEALYADMGHFGKTPIRIAWIGLVLPSLTLNYLGQCAMLADHPGAIDNPFFRMFPDWATVPAVAVSAIATVIASQAVISGAYSMTKEAIHLGFLPRMRIEHTSAREIRQVYIPAVNHILLAAVLLATVGFGSSTALASAYGIAVTTTMLITTLLTFFVIRSQFGLSLPVASITTGIFLALDAILVASCSLKFVEGGWFPLLVGVGLFAIMATWHRGQSLLLQSVQSSDPLLGEFVDALASNPGGIARVPGVAVFPVTSATTVPAALLHNLKHNHVLHEANVIAVLEVQEVPFVPIEIAIDLERLELGFWRVRYRYGFKDVPNLPYVLGKCADKGLTAPPMETSYFLSRAEVQSPTESSVSMSRWRSTIFATLARNAGSAAEHLQLPNNAVVVLRSRVQI